MITPSFQQKNFWRYSALATAITIISACGSQSVIENSGTSSTEPKSLTLVSEMGYEPAETTDEGISHDITLIDEDNESHPLPGNSAQPSEFAAESDVDIIASEQPVISDPEENSDLTVLASEESLTTISEPLALQENEKEDEQMLNIQPPQPRILFYSLDQKVLNSEQTSTLKQHADFLAVHPDFIIQIHGHTDNQGKNTYNEKLSMERAQKVADLLIESGVTPEQIEIFGWGSQDPLLSASQHDKNRRVELIYLSDQIAFSDSIGAEPVEASADQPVVSDTFITADQSVLNETSAYIE